MLSTELSASLRQMAATFPMTDDEQRTLRSAAREIEVAAKKIRKVKKLAIEMEDEDHGDLGGSARSYVRRELNKILEGK